MYRYSVLQGYTADETFYWLIYDNELKISLGLIFGSKQQAVSWANEMNQQERETQ